MKKFLFILLLLSTFSFSQNVELKGVVTYFFNQNLGYKPDVGAKMYIHKIAEKDSIKSPVITLRSYELMVGMNEKMSQYSTPSAEEREKYKKNKDSLTFYRNEVDLYVSKLKNSKETIIVSADGAGNYNVNIPAGFYEIVSESKNRSGLYRVETIHVKEGRPNIVDFEFNIIY